MAAFATNHQVIRPTSSPRQSWRMARLWPVSREAGSLTRKAARVQAPAASFTGPINS